uniref:DUF6291 domain-containing protein n=1 Tax=Siphoviridae sp. ctNHj22 TaxID=2825468 RepID=A0A8S5VFW9_9CAUD|nr:MAG TPA: hypothetical protein [Siphoviridae sp. ctNHj22]
MKTTKRSSFIILLEHVHTMEELTDAEFGAFIRAYAAYVEDGTEPAFTDRSMRMMWKTVKAFDEMNCKKFEDTSEKRREAARKGNEKRWHSDNGHRKNRNCEICDKPIANDSKNRLSVSESDSVSESVSDIESIDASASPSPRASKRFSPPGLEEIEAYFAEKGGTAAQAERFRDFYESNGWKVGKNPMKSWKAAASGWMSRDKESAQKASAPRSKPFMASRSPEEAAAHPNDFLKNAATRRPLRKKKGEVHNA